MSKNPQPPTSDVMLEAVEQFLNEEVAPHMQGYSAFRTRVALNILSMLRREQQLGPSDPDQDENLQQIASDLRAGKISWRDEKAFEQARIANLKTLMINNPKWIIEDQN